MQFQYISVHGTAIAHFFLGHDTQEIGRGWLAY